jgi:tetratricopeptide (TPR) repeat protein
MPHLQSGDDKAIEASLLMITALGEGELVTSLAKLYQTQGAFDALSQIAASPDHTTAHQAESTLRKIPFYRGVAYSNAGEYEKAVQELDLTVAQSPQHAAAYYSRAIASVAIGNGKLAEESYDRAVELNPGYAEREYTQGVVYTEPEDSQYVAKLTMGTYAIGRRMRLQGENRNVHLHPLRGQQNIYLGPYAEYYALEIPNDMRTSLGANEDDYALVARAHSAKVLSGVLEILGGLEYGNFQRDSDGSINFIRDEPPVIGVKDADNLQVGYIVALLRPE